VLIVCLSSMKDADQLLANHEALCLAKCHSFTVMGGVETIKESTRTPPPRRDPNRPRDQRGVQFAEAPSGASSGAAASSDDSFGKPRVSKWEVLKRKRKLDVVLEPDSANNNTFDISSAQGLYTRLQELGIRFNVLTRLAAYAAPVSRSVYDQMAASGHPVANRLFQVQRTSIEDLWTRACATGEARRGLPDRCDSQWFRQNFLGGAGRDRIGNDSVWDLVERFQMYDPLTVVLAVPHLAWIFFDPCYPVPPLVSSADPVNVVGYSSRLNGLRRPKELSEFLVSQLMTGVKLNAAAGEAAPGAKPNRAATLVTC